MRATQVVYHFKSPRMQGQTLYPLHSLRQRFPDAFADAVRKYRKRPALLEQRIARLDCRFNDVLHFSPLNPQRVWDAWDRLGVFEPHAEPPEVFRIPLSKLTRWPLAVFRPPADHRNHQLSDRDFGPFDPETYAELDAPTTEQLERWKAEIEAGRERLWLFSGTTHILCRGHIDVGDCETFRLTNPPGVEYG